jgi:hypothetical protein
VSNLVEKLEKLAAELEAMPKENGYADLKVTDIHEKFAHVLTPAAAEALSKDIHSTIGVKEWNEKVAETIYEGEGAAVADYIRRVEYTRAVYLSVTARSPEGMERAGKLIYEEVNKLAEAGLLRGNLCRLSMLRITDAPPGLSKVELGPGKPGIAFFCFPHVPMEAKVEGPYFTEEGGMPVDLEPELKPAVISSVSLVEQMEAEVRIAAMERCCIETPCFVDACPKCSAG